MECLFPLKSCWQGKGGKKSLIKLLLTVKWFGGVILGGILLGYLFSQTASQWLSGREQLIHQSRENLGEMHSEAGVQQGQPSQGQLWGCWHCSQDPAHTCFCSTRGEAISAELFTAFAKNPFTEPL